MEKLKDIKDVVYFQDNSELFLIGFFVIFFSIMIISFIFLFNKKKIIKQKHNKEILNNLKDYLLNNDIKKVAYIFSLDILPLISDNIKSEKISSELHSEYSKILDLLEEYKYRRLEDTFIEDKTKQVILDFIEKVEKNVK